MQRARIVIIFFACTRKNVPVRQRCARPRKLVGDGVCEQPYGVYCLNTDNPSRRG